MDNANQEFERDVWETVANGELRLLTFNEMARRLRKVADTIETR